MYWVYQVPIMTIAYLPVRKALLASGYCCAPTAPDCMMPSENSCCQMARVLTMPGSFHLASPLDTLVQRPGCTLLAIDWSVSWSKPSCEAPWTKQPWPWDLKTWQSLTHSASVVGAVRLYLSNRSLLIQSMPA